VNHKSYYFGSEFFWGAVVFVTYLFFFKFFVNPSSLAFNSCEFDKFLTYGFYCQPWFSFNYFVYLSIMLGVIMIIFHNYCRKMPILLIIGFVMGSFLMNILIAGISPEGMNSIWQDFKNNPYNVIFAVDKTTIPQLTANCQTFYHTIFTNRLMPLHFYTHPPGPLFFMIILKKTLHFSCMGIALITIFLSCLSLVMVYYSTKELFDAKSAELAILLYSFIPSIIFYSNKMDAIYNLLSITTATFYIMALKRKSYLWMLLAGITFFLLSLFSGIAWPLLLILAILYRFHSPREAGLWRFNLLFLAPVTIIYLWLYWQWRFNYLDILNINITATRMYVACIHRSPWFMLISPLVFLFSLGIPLGIDFFQALNLNKITSPLPWVLLSIIILPSLNSGFWGESERIFLFLIPYMTIYLSATFAQLWTKRQSWLIAGSLLLQCIVTKICFFLH